MSRLLNPRFGSIFLSLSLLSASCGGLAPTPETPSSSNPTEITSQQKRFDGVTINVSGLKFPIGNAFEAHAKAFEEMTGAEIVFKTVGFGELYDTLVADYATETNQYDLIVYPPIWLPDFVNANYLADLTSRVETDESLAWDDIAPFFQKYGGTYNDKIYGIPVDGDYYMLYYRSDLLEAAGLEPPRTWDEYLAIAAQFHGQDLNGDGTPDYGSCLPKQENHVAGWAFWSIAGSFLQSKGTNQGGFFDLETMEPLTNNEAFAQALDIYKATNQYSPASELQNDMEAARSLFINGECALSMDHGNMGVMTIAPQSQVVDLVGTTLLPGSEEVLDRETGKLIPCDKFTCPFAIDGVNHAPYAALIGWTAGVNGASTPDKQDAAYAFISYVSQPAQSNIDVTVGATGLNPYRISQFTDIDLWVNSGMGAETANKYMGGIGASLNNPNMMLDLTIPGNDEYQRTVLDATLAAFLRDELSRDEAMTEITTNWENITDAMGRDQQRIIYRTGLGLQP